MAHTEGEIRSAVKLLVDAYGELTTTEVKKCLEDVLPFDDEDLKKSKTRNETLIIQRIGNIVSHQTEITKIYPEGFELEKKPRNSIFRAVEGLGARTKAITKTEIIKRRTKAKRTERRRRIYKKVDWDLNNERNTKLGTMGEEFVFHREREYVRSFDPTCVERVIHLSASQGDGFGYDISSVNKLGETVYIEVKTTKGKKDSPFFMSRNERLFFEENKDNNAFIYRVYEFDEYTKHGKILKISANDLLTNYVFDPITFMVFKRRA